jgi:F-type H+-transporting ATPase subunit c
MVFMKAMRLAFLVVVVLLLTAVPVLAQGPAPTPGSYSFTGASVGAGLGIALTIVGAGYGFGRIGAAALEGMARQPEVAGQIQTAMLIIAALLEGATFFALIICIIISGKSIGGL